MTQIVRSGQSEILIKNKLDAVKCIGQKVYWHDTGRKYVMLRCGVLEEWYKRQVCIDGNWFVMSSLENLRNYKGKGWE